MAVKTDECCEVKILKHCCALIYDEMLRLGLQPGREDWARSDIANAELLSKIRGVWIKNCGGDPMCFPWDRGFVTKTFIQHRKLKKDEKDKRRIDVNTLPLSDIGFVYFLRNTRNHIKIGWSGKDPVQRMRDLQTGESELLKLVGVMPGSELTEDALHLGFALYRIRPNGEWFYTNRKLEQLIKDNPV